MLVCLESGKELKEFAGFSLYSAYKTFLESGKELKANIFLTISDSDALNWNPERN